MARYLLDTNILAFLVSGDSDNISKEKKAILTDYYNQLYTSWVSIVELLQLYRIKKIKQRNLKRLLKYMKLLKMYSTSKSFLLLKSTQKNFPN